MQPRNQRGREAGIAGGFEKGSYVGTCAEVSVDRTSGAVRVVRVVVAFECGAIVSPNHLRNQVEGAISMGLGGALFEQIQIRRRQDPQRPPGALSRAALPGHAGD